MTTLITIDETSGVQNVQGTITSNDTSAALPQLFQDALAFENAGGGPITGVALSGVDGTAGNAGGVQVMSFTGSVTDVGFTDASGNALSGVNSGLKTTDGTTIYLYTSTVNNNVVVGRKGLGGDAVFAVYLDTGVDTGSGDPGATGAKLWLVEFEAIEHSPNVNANDIELLSGVLNVTVDSLMNFSLAGAPSGNNLFLTFGHPADPATSTPDVSLIVVSKDAATGGTVNSSQGGGGTTLGTDNQMVIPTRGMYFTFVTDTNPDFTVPNLDHGEATTPGDIQFGGLFGSGGGSFAIVQLQQDKAATLKLSASFSTSVETGASFISGLNDADDQAINVNSITITRTVVVKKVPTIVHYTFTDGGSTTPQGGVTVDFSGTSAVIQGLLASDRVEYATASDHTRILIENLGGAKGFNAAFDIGDFQLTSGSLATRPVDDLAFVDDGPSATIVRTANVMALDETQGAKAGDANAALDDISGTNTDPFAGAYGTPIGALQGVDLVNTTSSVGADTDGATTVVALAVVGGSGADSGLKTTAGTQIDLWLESNGTITGRTGGSAGTVIFAVKMASDGTAAVAQYAALQHPTTGSSYDESVNLSGKINAVITVTDGDDDVATNSVDVGAAISFDDDGPTVSTNNAVQLDDDALSGNSGGVGDVDPDTANTSGTLAHTYGADGAGSMAYLTTGAPSGFSYQASGSGLLVKQNGNTVLTLTLNTTTGAYTVTQNAAISHAAGSDENNQDFTINYRVTDGDSDTADGTLSISVDDDTAVINSRSDLIYANGSNPSPGGTGIFDYSIGADVHTAPYSSSNSDFSSVSLASGSVGSTPITNPTVAWASEDASTAVFNVAFDYISNPSLNTTTHQTGTLTFDKAADTYKLALAAPIQSFTILTTSTAQGFQGYVLNSATQDNSGLPPVSVAKLANNFLVQFTGYEQTGGNSPVSLTAGTTNPTAYTAGELFTAATSTVSISGLSAGVASDTMQNGEVLDMDFFTADPQGFTTVTPTAKASGIYLKFDGILSGPSVKEDLVVLLKLIDASGDAATRTTKVIVVDGSDVFTHLVPPPTGYNIALDNNDGVVIIESNDFNAAGQNYVIEGAQVMVSTEGVSGTGTNLNPASGANGGSSASQAFGLATSTSDKDVIKISDIGFLSAVTPDAHLTFNAAVVDADGDPTATQTMDVTIVSGSTFTAGTDREAIQGRAGVADTFVFSSVANSPAGANHDIVSGFVSGVDKIDVSGIDANSVGGGANDSFTYINTAAFSNVAGQMRFDAAAHLLQGDVNGDGTADLVVELVAVGSVAAGDLVL